MYCINISQVFPQPTSVVFDALAHHASFAKIVGANLVEVRQETAQVPDGIGSVRRIRAFPGIEFEETIVGYQPNALIEYRVTAGSPIKNHFGRIQLTALPTGCQLDYSIDFEPKLAIPGLGNLLVSLIRAPIAKGLANFANSHHHR